MEDTTSTARYLRRWLSNIWMPLHPQDTSQVQNLLKHSRHFLPEHALLIIFPSIIFPISHPQPSCFINSSKRLTFTPLKPPDISVLVSKPLHRACTFLHHRLAKQLVTEAWLCCKNQTEHIGRPPLLRTRVHLVQHQPKGASQQWMHQDTLNGGSQ